MKTWGSKSMAVIQASFKAIKKEQPSLTNDEILKIVNQDHYPFGRRELWPYKAWLKALKDVKNILDKWELPK